MPVTIINPNAGGGSPLETIAPSAPGAAAPINQNVLPGERVLQNIQSPAGEPATADAPYYLLLDDGSGNTEHVLVLERSDPARTILAPVTRLYTAGSGTVAFAGLATSPASAGLLTALRHHELGQLDADGLNVQSGTITSPTSLTVQPTQATVAGAAKRDLVLRSGDGEASANGDSGDVVIDAGWVGPGATPGSILIAQLNAAAINSGNGTTPWTHDGDLAVTGDVTVTGQVLGANLVKHNFAAVTLPTASDDSTAGYSVGSRWVVPGAGELVCVDAAPGAAVWLLVAATDPPYLPTDGSAPMSGALDMDGNDLTGAAAVRLAEQPGDVADEANVVAVYARDDGAGVSALFARTDDGEVHQLTGRAPATRVRTTASTSESFADSADGSVVLCTAASDVDQHIGDGEPIGKTVEFVQMGTGRVRIVAAGSMVARVAPTFLPNTAEQYSSVFVTIISATEYLVRGDLEVA